MLRCMSGKAKPAKEVFLAPGLPATGLIGRDVSILDPRSVKAQLAGRFNWGAAWWNLCCRLQQKFCKDKSLEMAMYRFHKVHHEVYFAPYEVMAAYAAFRKDIRERGIFAACRTCSGLGR